MQRLVWRNPHARRGAGCAAIPGDMKSAMTETAKQINTLPERRFLARFGTIVVSAAVGLAIFTLFVFADFTPIPPSNFVVVSLFLANLLIILILLILMAAEIWRLVSARRAQAAGARLHIRIVALFSVIAAAPALLIALVGSVTLDRSLNPAFLEDVRGFVYNTAEAARLFRESQCRSLLQETRLTALDVSRAKPFFDTNRPLFTEFFYSRARFLGFTVAALIKPDGTVLERVDPPPEEKEAADKSKPVDAEKPAEPKAEPVPMAQPDVSDFEDARKNELTCLILGEGRTFVALREVPDFGGVFVYASRPIDPFAIQFPAQAASLINLYDAYDAHRHNIQIAFATMYVLIALIMLLSAIWIGLNFATRLITPIRRLIAATDQVSTGNLYVQVPVQRGDGDLGHLGDTFNKMTSELRLQQNRLIAASQLMDDRRQFTEAVLSGVPAAVIGVDAQTRITVLNPSAQKLLLGDGDALAAIGKPLSEVAPELAPHIVEARANPTRLFQSQTTMMRQGRERMFNLRVTTTQSGEANEGCVVTLDDITELVSAQRTSAWADVAQRIAHEIKNPLTPIQLSAERLKRKYGRVITQDREIFDQCTDTIVRQVDDIKRMVDEFSSFARMPKAKVEEDDLSACVKQVLFLMRVGNPDVVMEEHLPDVPVIAQFDRRLLSQALTNIIKNATEGITADAAERGVEPRIDTYLSVEDSGMVVIDVIDNGKGFPTENRHRLLEPYVTTRSEGTGLGLPIVAKIFEDHGGGIELLDAPDGQGARVRLFFPRRRDVSGDAVVVQLPSSSSLVPNRT